MQSNIEIIQNYLDGVRPVLKTGYTPPKEAQRPIGEIWTDDKGFTWEQKNGYIVKNTRMGKAIRDAIGEKVCPDCKKEIKWSTNRFDERMFDTTGKCYDCLITFETQLRIEGKFKDYEQKKILKNQRSEINSKKVELEEALAYVEKEKVITFVNQTGLVEEWPNTHRIRTMKAIKKDLKLANQYIQQIDAMLEKLSHV